jgi:Spy/CpxP family protein refolding chaperone
MRRLSRFAALSLLALVAPLSAYAQDAAVPQHPVRHRIRECLSILDLSDAQKTQIQAILEAAKPTFETNVAAVHAARETLRTAADTVPPDACAIGNDFLAVKAAVATLLAQRDAVRGQIVATLTPEQQARYLGCLDAPADATPTATPDVTAD